jgi:GNAT superfamily N-acetyltransferase
MAISRWRAAPPITGPSRARVEDIGELNAVFSDAFTDRYRRDGMVGVRVPNLNPRIWRYAIEDAADGAMVWRDEHGRIVAFNMVHQSGAEGWMGPLAVRTDSQGHGRGTTMVQGGLAWLRERGARVIGLETMPRTMDNVGFYSKIGFLPGAMTVTVSIEAMRSDDDLVAFRQVSTSTRTDLLAEARSLLDEVAPAYDYTREIVLTQDLELGDALGLSDASGRMVGFALAHGVPLVEGRAADELRVLKLVLRDEADFPRMARGLASHARRIGVRRAAIRMQGEYGRAYGDLMALGGHVRWTDLRMALAGFQDRKPATGMVLSNWEI